VVLTGGPSNFAGGNFSYNIDTTGKVTLLDNNTGLTETITGANFLVFEQNQGNPTNGPLGMASYITPVFIETGIGADIVDLYSAALGRAPDTLGDLAYYEKALTPASAGGGGYTLETVAAFFATSNEFSERFPAAAAAPDSGGPHDQAFITQLYQNVEHRTPTAAELTYYEQLLAGTEAGGIKYSRADVLNFVAEAPESQQYIGWLINPANGGFTGFTAAAGGGAPAAITAGGHGTEAGGTLIGVQTAANAVAGVHS
jgi:hypothetical protein